MDRLASISSPAQRTAIQLRPHDQSRRLQIETTAPVVLHHGRPAGRRRWQRVAAGSCNGLLGSSGMTTERSRTAGEELPEATVSSRKTDHNREAERTPPANERVRLQPAAL